MKRVTFPPRITLSRLSAYLMAFGLAAMAWPARAQIIANFTGGNGTAQVDQYTGKAGNGWAGAWSLMANSSSYITASVVNTNPLTAGGGNYLSVSNSNAAFSSAAYGVGRAYSSANGVVLTSSYTISFDFRLDSPTSTFNSSNDGVGFFGSSDQVLGGYNSFQIQASYTGGTMQWQWRNSTTFSNAGMSLVTGTVYQFTLNVNPTAHNYTISIFDGTNTVTSGTLGFRNTSLTSYPYLNFYSKDYTNDTITYSLDNIVVAVPEPGEGMLSLAGCAVLGVVLGVRRRVR